MTQPNDLPSSFVLKMDESKVPKKILEILRRGLDMRKHPYCVAFSMMQSMCYSGTWGNGSFRFLHCVCKMIDEGTPKSGTTMLTSHRAMKGWGVCDEDLHPSDVSLSVPEFEDWNRISKEAWDDARQQRVQRNKALVNSGSGLKLKSNGKDFYLFTHAFNVLRREDKQFELLVIDSEFETVAWATLRAYVQQNQIVLEDLFVKRELRGKAHLGTKLLRRVEQIACLEEPFTRLNHVILAPISNPDAGPTRYNAVREFFLKRGYTWKNTDPIMKYAFDWSTFTAVKKLDCVAIHNDYALVMG
jgi:hypothetical protein